MDKSKFLVSAKPVARTVKFHDGTEEVLHFRQPSAAEFRRWKENEMSDDPEVRHTAAQLLIAASLCEEDGALVLSKEEAAGLTFTGVNDLFPHVLAVSGINTDAKKD